MIGCPLEQMDCKFSGSKSTAYPQDLSTAFSMQQIAVFCSGAEFLWRRSATRSNGDVAFPLAQDKTKRTLTNVSVRFAAALNRGKP